MSKVNFVVKVNFSIAFYKYVRSLRMGRRIFESCRRSSMFNSPMGKYVLCVCLMLIGSCLLGSSFGMVFPGDDWQRVRPEEAKVDSGKLAEAVEYLKNHSGRDGVRELVIIRNGYMIHKGDNIDKVHGVWSCTKSFTSTVLGLLIDEKKTSLGALAKDYVPEMAENYGKVTLKHFTTMTSGYRAVGDEPKGGYTHGPSTTPFTPGPEPLFEPGTKYAYWDSAMNQFANVLARIADEPIEDVFKRRIAEPIGMHHDKWRWGDFGKVDGLVINGGSGNNNKHIFICAREIARLGQLFLNRGNWNGKQLISSEWVDLATRVHVPASMPLGHLQSGIDGRGVYGFNWWNNGIKPDGKRKWPDAPVGTYCASGHNNNKMFIIPEWNMVIVRLGLDQRDNKISDAVWNTFLRKVGRSLDEMMGPLKVHPTNPRYFTDDTGKAIYLTGSHTWNNLVDMGPDDPPEKFDFDASLEWKRRYNHNFIRLWAWELTQWDTTGNREKKALKHFVAPHPWKRTGPGKALDGKAKFDLTKYNAEYFQRLRRRIKKAYEQNIYVSIMLFEGWGMQFSPNAWTYHPMNPKNNINEINGDHNSDGRGLEVHTLTIPSITQIQKAYVKKVIDTVNEFDNVLYEISNENHPLSAEWQYHIIRFIKSYEKSKSKQHPVGMTFQYKGGSNKTLFDSPADWISPNNQGGYRDNPPLGNGQKVILTDTDHLWGIGGNDVWVWKSFLRGLNPLFMDPYKGKVLKKSYDPKWVEPLRKSLGYTLTFARRMDLAAMVPRNDLATTKYCLADPGREYLVYLPETTSVTLDLSDAEGDFAVEWFAHRAGKAVLKGNVRGGSKRMFKSPVGAPSVLYLKTRLAGRAVKNRRGQRERLKIRPRATSKFSINKDNTGTELDGRPFLVIGLRVSNALISDDKTKELIEHMDEFATFGINSFSVFFQGSRFGDVKGYREDATLDPVYAARMGRIIEAADKRGMVILVGCLYYGNSRGKWGKWKQADANHAIANTVRWLKENGYRNVFVDVNNEHMAGFDDAQLIAAGKAVDYDYVIGTSGKNTTDNADLSMHHGKPDIPGKYYIQTEGTMNGGYWGPYSKKKDYYNYINIGVYTDEMKKQMLEYTDRYLDRGQGYIFASTWLQCIPPFGPNHNPGGMGTAADAGVRWWLEHLKDRSGSL